MSDDENQIPLFRGVIEPSADGRPPVSDERPDTLPSKTYKLRVPFGTGILDVFITVSDKDDRPYEFFINCTNVELSEHLTAISALGSRMLRNGFPVEAVARDLMDIASPHTGHMRRKGYCQSLSALIGWTLLAHARGETPE
ncbi:MAG: hypothetical protein H6983_16695 [Ectothiorhodospiraceae bacterium]|nr:hypothetical protein [Ectothiorhodospiraceae bacterium]